jgi:hypothetical protein
MKSNLLRSLQSGPVTAFEQMENAVLEEQGFLSSELRRLTRSEGKETTSATVQTLLEVLERRADELKLKRSADIQVEDISDCLTQIRQSPSFTDLASEVKSITDIEDDLVVVSGEMSSLITSLQSKQLAVQADALGMLDDRLVTDAEKRSFAHGGGIAALLQMLTSEDSDVVHKSLEVLHRATYFESGRAHRELTPLSIAEVVSGFCQSGNKSHSLFASCIITNLLHLKDGKSPCDERTSPELMPLVIQLRCTTISLRTKASKMYSIFWTPKTLSWLCVRSGDFPQCPREVGFTFLRRNERHCLTRT